MWRIWTLVPGVLIIAFALREVFQDLFHPHASGDLSDFIGRRTFRLLRRRRSSLALAGPLSLVIVIFTWAMLFAVGFALIYWGSFPQDFRLGTDTSPAAEHGFSSILYFSLEVMTTLGLGDLAPKPGWIRLLTVFEALIGFSLVTASVSWIVLLYPALSRLRTLARRTSILAQAERNTGIGVVGHEVQSLIGELGLDVIRTRVDLIHFPMIYYFYAENQSACLASNIAHLVRFAAEGSRAGYEDRVRLSAATLRAALDDLAEVLAQRFVHADPRDPDAVFRAYADDHLATYG